MATNREYTKDFNNNVKVSLEAENIAKELLEQLTGKQFYSVRDDPTFYHVGDLITIDGAGYDVKDDGVINWSNNVFCEVRKHWRDGTITDGWMLNGEYTYLVVLDRVKNNIYVLDFEKLKQIYKSGKPKYGIDMGDNYTDGFAVPLAKCRKQGILTYESKYKHDDLLGDYFITI